jgi:hypothetical protein
MICLTGKIVHNTPNVICMGTDGHTDILTHIWSRFRDKLSLLRSLVQHNNTVTQQHNNTTTQQHNNTTTQQHNNTTTQ